MAKELDIFVRHLSFIHLDSIPAGFLLGFTPASVVEDWVDDNDKVGSRWKTERN